jgi:hypothetical protein
LAKSQDWTVAIGLNIDGVVCRWDRWQGPWEDTIRRLAGLIDAPALVDSTGVGDPILEALQAAGVFAEGFQFTTRSKQDLMRGLQVAIQKREIRFPEGQILRELESFEYEYREHGVRYEAPTGLHDDCVMALALAWRHLSRGGLVISPEAVTGTSYWRAV